MNLACFLSTGVGYLQRVVAICSRYVLACAGCVFLMIAGLFQARVRARLYEVVYQLGWRKRPAREPDAPALLVPAVAANALLPPSVVLRMAAFDTADGNVSGYELAVINALVAAFRPENCFEIGTFDGRTTVNIAANLVASGQVYTLDLPASEHAKTRLPLAHGDDQFICKPVSGSQFSGTPWAGRITQLYGDSATFDFSPYAGQMDLVFVDGAHSYAYVKNDTRMALRLLRPTGGMILWHDYGSPYWKGLTQALNELRQEIPALAAIQHIAGTTLVCGRLGNWVARSANGPSD